MDLTLRHERLEVLLRAMQRLSLARGMAEVMEVVRHTARTLCGADGASFVLRDDGHCYYADEEAITPLWKGRRFPMQTCVTGWTMEHREPAIIEDIEDDSRVPPEIYRPTFVRSMVAVPIRTLDPIGAIGAYWAQRRSPTSEEVGLLQALADATAVAIENVRVYENLEERVRDRTRELEETNRRLVLEVAERRRAEEEIRRLSLTDSLTGLFNRRGFYVHAEQALKKAHRTGRLLSLIFVDLDGLKPVNDELGHEVGDALIQDAAEVLSSMVREADVLARMGGDEFVILLADGDRPNLIRRRLDQAVIDFNASGNRPYAVSLSAGAVRCTGHGIEHLDRALAMADQRMYAVKRAKRRGRDAWADGDAARPIGPGAA